MPCCNSICYNQAQSPDHFPYSYCTTLPYTALHCTSLNSNLVNIQLLLCSHSCVATGQHSIQWAKKTYCTALYCTGMQYNAMQCNTLQCTALHCTALQCTALSRTALHCTALHCTVLLFTALHCTALHCTALHCSELHYTTMHFTTLNSKLTIYNVQYKQ